MISDRWIRMPMPSGTFLGYSYLDSTAGLSAKGVLIEWPATPATAAAAVTQPSYTVRLHGVDVDQVTVLDDAEVAALELPGRPAWADYFGPTPGERPWRDDPAMRAHSHPDLPDDFQAIFYFWSIGRAERMWVSLRVADPAVGGFAGTLLNQPYTPGVVSQGDTVTIRVAPGVKEPIWVSPTMRANLARWKVRCNDCGFDMMMAPAEYIAEKQFPGSPDGFVPVAFTTRCDLCQGTAMVETRV